MLIPPSLSPFLSPPRSKVGASLFPSYIMVTDSTDDVKKKETERNQGKEQKKTEKKNKDGTRRRRKAKRQKMHFCLERDYHEAVLSLHFDSPSIPVQLSDLLVFGLFRKLRLGDEARDLFAEVASSPFDFHSLTSAVRRLGARFQHRFAKENKAFARRTDAKDLLHDIHKDAPLKVKLDILGGLGGLGAGDGGDGEDDEDPWIAETSVFTTKGVKDWRWVFAFVRQAVGGERTTTDSSIFFAFPLTSASPSTTRLTRTGCGARPSLNPSTSTTSARTAGKRSYSLIPSRAKC